MTVYEGSIPPGLREQIESIPDPELPFLSIAELGIVRSIKMSADAVAVELTPTFSGCPVVEMLAAQVSQIIEGHGLAGKVHIVQAAWSSSSFEQSTLDKMKQHGIAPPLPLEPVCPYCESRDTLQENLFGPTACRQIYYCRSCSNPFEKFKLL